MSEPLNPTREDRWAAVLCHASGLTIFFGILVPLVTYLTQKDRSPFLKVQALQALLFQGIALIVYWVFSIGMLVVYFGTFFPMVIITSTATEESGWIVAIFFIVFGLIMLVSFFFAFILVPAYFILVLLAAWRSGNGHDFRYPIIGTFVKN
jgi:uncharacterized protein